MGAGGGSVTIRDERTVGRVLKRLVAYREELVCLWGVFGFVTSHVWEKLAGVQPCAFCVMERIFGYRVPVYRRGVFVAKKGKAFFPMGIKLAFDVCWRVMDRRCYHSPATHRCSVSMARSPSFLPCDFS